MESEILGESEPHTSNSKVLEKPEPVILESKFLVSSKSNTKNFPIPKFTETKVLNDLKSHYLRTRVHGRKRPFITNPKGPIKLWVPKYKIVFALVRFGGNQKGKIIVIDTIASYYIYINNDWLVDGLKHNLLSISQFCDRGHGVVFNNNM